MEREDAKKLFKKLAASYPTWKVDKDIAENWIEELEDADSEHAWANAREHIRENKFPPSIAAIVRLNSDIKAARDIEQTRQRILEQEEREKNVLPPPWVREGIDKMIWLKRQIAEKRGESK